MGITRFLFGMPVVWICLFIYHWSKFGTDAKFIPILIIVSIVHYRTYRSLLSLKIKSVHRFRLYTYTLSLCVLIYLEILASHYYGWQSSLRGQAIFYTLMEHIAAGTVQLLIIDISSSLLLRYRHDRWIALFVYAIASVLLAIPIMQYMILVIFTDLA
jgi:hypothetical protein